MAANGYRDRYFDHPSESTTTQRTSNSSLKSITKVHKPCLIPIRLYLSGRDLPEPDSRSRATIAVIYHAHESPSVVESLSSRISDNGENADLTPQSPPPGMPIRLPSAKSYSLQPSDIQSPPSSPPLARFKKSRSFPTPRRAQANALRAPDNAGKVIAPPAGESFLTAAGVPMHRTPWLELGSTELARKEGRDVEFARNFAFNYVPGTNQMLRIALYDATSKKIERRRLIGITQVQVSSVVAGAGKPLPFPLKFMPLSDRDMKKSSRIPEGTIVIAAEVVKDEGTKFRLDVECNRILRAKSLGMSSVKKVFYAIHAILEDVPQSDKWVLLYRSNTVEMIHRKRDGGSLEYNYFSSRRLLAAPGVIIEDHDAKLRAQKERIARGDPAGDYQTAGLAGYIAEAIGKKQKDLFFSLPGADLTVSRPESRLRLSLYEDNGLKAGFEIIASTEFTVSDLRTRQLGASSPVRIHSSTVGKAVLKYVECSPDPKYFCMSLKLQGHR